MNNITLAAFRDELEKIAFDARPVGSVVNRSRQAAQEFYASGQRVAELGGHMPTVVKNVRQAAPDAQKVKALKDAGARMQASGALRAQSAARPQQPGLFARLFGKN